jgi:hypothetical protein
LLTNRKNDHSVKERTIPSGFWLAAIVAGINALVSMGFAIAFIASSSSSTAWYAADRAAALLAAVIVVSVLRHRAGLLVVGWMLAGVQAADALIGLGAGDIRKVIGPAVLAVATGVVLVRLTRAPRPDTGSRSLAD